MQLNMRIILGLIAVTSFGCASNEFTGEELSNQAPDVWFTAGPSDGIVASYKSHFFWMGWDEDGDVLFFEYAITDDDAGTFDPDTPIHDDEWGTVSRFDSTFNFSADVLVDANVDPDTLRPLEYQRPHTLVLRAVDDRGLRSSEIAYRSFIAKNLSPVVDVTLPSTPGDTPVDVPPVTTFAWSGQDFIGNENETQSPDSVRHLLVDVDDKFAGDRDAALAYIRSTPNAEEWGPFRNYNALDGSGTSWMPPPLDTGMYLFAVQVKDEAGAVNTVFDLQRNVRAIRVVTGTAASLERTH